MLSDKEIAAIDAKAQTFAQFSRAIIAAHTAKLLAGVEMPEPAGCVWCDYGDLDGAVIRPKGYYTRTQESPLYTADQLQQYAAAAAAQARMKALDEAKGVCEEVHSDSNGEKYDMFGSNLAEQCAAGIDRLTGGE